MNLIFMRHGEATDNVKEIISDKEIYWSVLTEEGERVVKESVKAISWDVDKIYVSPLPRTIQTAHFLCEKFPGIEVLIDGRLKEIQYGKYSGKQNNPELDNARIEQINGNYFIRFGDFGENKYEIEKRLCDFLIDVKNNNFDNNTIAIVSHGSITSYMKRILNLKSQHLSTGKIDVFLDVEFSSLYKKIRELKNEKQKKIAGRLSMLENVMVGDKLKKNLIKIAKNEFDNLEFSDDIFGKYIQGLTTRNIKLKTPVHFSDGIIVVCFYNNFENFAKVWMEHYISIGIKNFVMVDNESTDDSTKILMTYKKHVNIAFWEVNERYDCNKMCGWKQQIFNFYGNRAFITVDSDELFAYKGFEKITFEEFINKNRLNYVKSLMVDVYSNEPIIKSNLADFTFVDRDTYKKTINKSFGERFFGGPRARVFGVRPSLQKVPFIRYTGEQVFINDHFYYPWSINKKAKLKACLFHYKFLPGDVQKYHEFALDGRHWNSSREYKIYDQVLGGDSDKSFYSEEHSVEMKNFKLPQ